MPQEHGLRIRAPHQSCQRLYGSRCQNWLCACPRYRQQCINTACTQKECALVSVYDRATVRLSAHKVQCIRPGCDISQQQGSSMAEHSREGI